MAKEKKKSRWKKAGWLALSFLLFASIAFFIAGSVSGVFPYARKLPDLIEAAKREGVPFSEPEYQSMIPRSPESNAFPVIKKSTDQLMEAIRKMNGLEGKRLPNGMPDYSKVDQIWKEEQAAIKAVESVQDYKEYRVENAPGLGFPGINPEILNPRTWAKLCGYRAHSAAMQRDWPEMLRAMKIASNMSRLSNHEETLLAFLSKNTTDSGTVFAISQILATESIPAEARESLRKINEAFLQEASAVTVMKRETYDKWKMMSELKPTDDFLGAVRSGWENRQDGFEAQIHWILRLPKTSEAFQAFTLEQNLEVLKLAKANLPTTQARIAAITKLEGRKLPPLISAFNEYISGAGAGILLPGLRLVADARINDLAIRCLDYRDKNGAWPTDFSSFGDSGIDPFDGKPMRMKRIGTGLRIWAISRAQKDLGGVKPSSGPGNTVIELK